MNENHVSYIVSYFDFKKVGYFLQNNTGISILESQNECWMLASHYCYIIFTFFKYIRLLVNHITVVGQTYSGRP